MNKHMLVRLCGTHAKTCRRALKTNFASLEKQSFGKEKAAFLQNGAIKGI